MNEFFQVFAIGMLGGAITYLGVPIAERFAVSARVVSGALQFAAGFLAGTIVLNMLVPAIQEIEPLAVVLAFLVGGSFYVGLELLAARRMQAGESTGSAEEAGAGGIGLYVAILGDMLVDGLMIGIGAALSLGTGLRLAIGLSVSHTPLAFVATATAKTQEVSAGNRRWLGLAFFLSVVVGTLAGYLLLRNQSDGVQLLLIAGGGGFLLTAVAQGMVPEAVQQAPSRGSGIFFVLGLTLYGLVALFLD